MCFHVCSSMTNMLTCLCLCLARCHDEQCTISILKHYEYACMTCKKFNS